MKSGRIPPARPRATLSSKREGNRIRRNFSEKLVAMLFAEGERNRILTLYHPPVRPIPTTLDREFRLRNCQMELIERDTHDSRLISKDEKRPICRERGRKASLVVRDCPSDQRRSIRTFIFQTSINAYSARIYTFLKFTCFSCNYDNTATWKYIREVREQGEGSSGRKPTWRTLSV